MIDALLLKSLEIILGAVAGVAASESYPHLRDLYKKRFGEPPQDHAAFLKSIKDKIEDEEFRSELVNLLTTIGLAYPDDRFPSPPRLFGRDKDLIRLKTFLNPNRNDGPQVMQLIGQSGVGKTILAAEAARNFNLDYVRLELREDATADRVAIRLYNVLTWQPDPNRPFEEIVGMIIDAWGQLGCVIVLDNVHRLLDADAKPKDERTALLLKRLGEAGHKLLAMGWPGTGAFGDSTEIVTRWELEGISQAAGVDKLEAEGVEGKPKSVSLEQVVARLDGNPRMLELLARLIEDHKGDASLIDDYPSWIRDSMAPLNAMWDALSWQLQELLLALCIFRRGRTVERLGRYLTKDQDEVRGWLRALLRWQLIRSIDNGADYIPDHDLVRRMVAENREEDIHSYHKHAAARWLTEVKQFDEKETPTRLTEIQPLLEAGYHFAQARDGKALFGLLEGTRFGETTFAEIADRLGAWADRVYLWRITVDLAEHNHQKAVLRHRVGVTCQRRGDWDWALREYEAGLKIFEELGDWRFIAASRLGIGTVYQLKGDRDRALEECRAGLKISEELKDRGIMAACRHQIGIVYQSKGDWERALEVYEAGLKTFEELGNRTGVAYSHHQIGRVYQSKGDWDRALESHEASLKIKVELGDRWGIATSRHQIGMLYQVKGDWERAQKEYRTSLEIKERLGDLQGVAMTHGQLGLLFREMKQCSAAFAASLRAFLILSKIGDPLASQALAHLLRLRVEWGTNNFDKAWKTETSGDVPDWFLEAVEEFAKQKDETEGGPS